MKSACIFPNSKGDSLILRFDEHPDLSLATMQRVLGNGVKSKIQIELLGQRSDGLSAYGDEDGKQHYKEVAGHVVWETLRVKLALLFQCPCPQVIGPILITCTNLETGDEISLTQDQCVSLQTIFN